MRRSLSIVCVLLLLMQSFLVLFVAPPRALAATGAKPVIVLDPGHSGNDIIGYDKATNILDHDYPNELEMTEVFEVARQINVKLTADGYTVYETKSSEKDTKSLRERADFASILHKADLAVSIHDDHTHVPVPRTFSNFADVYTQKTSLYRVTKTKTNIYFKLDQVAQESQKAGALIVAARAKSEGRAVHNTDVDFTGRGPNIADGNIPLVMLFATVPWVYNELGADGNLTPAQIKQYADGITAGIEQYIPASGGGTGGSNSSAEACYQSAIGPNPGKQPPLPPECANSGGGSVTGPCGAVIDWDQQINDNLVIGGGGSLSGSGYDNLSKTITSPCGSSSPRSKWAGQYWCTYSIVDSYTIAGIKGLDIGPLGGVVNMHAWWMKQPGFIYVEYEKAPDKLGALQKVHPGYAMFMESQYLVHNNNEHVAEVKSITIDAKGNGSLTTLDSNSGKQEHTYTIVNGNIQPIIYPIAAFGGH